MKFTDKVGNLEISPESAIQFVQSWFLPDDRICVVGRRTVRTGSLDVVSQTMAASELIDSLEEGMLESIIFDSDGSSYNLYVSVCPVQEDLGLFRRGTKDNVAYVPGVWADLDIKEGGFTSEEEILSWLASLPLRPSIICGSGSGGIHAYWRLNWDQQGDGELVEQWWSFLHEMAGDRSIDKLVDTTRILRIPGSVYFPKPDAEDQSLKMVKLISLSGYVYDKKQLQDVSHDAYERRKASRAKLRYDDAQRKMDVDSLARSLMSNGVTGRWALMRAIAAIEDFINKDMDWTDILIPHGWTLRQELRDGSSEWARPGQSDRSAVTDYEDSPVMSLLSTSEDTGLSDLKDAGIPLTKYRVLLRLDFNDDEKALVPWAIARLKGTTKK